MERWKFKHLVDWLSLFLPLSSQCIVYKWLKTANHPMSWFILNGQLVLNLITQTLTQNPLRCWVFPTRFCHQDKKLAPHWLLCQRVRSLFTAFCLLSDQKPFRTPIPTLNKCTQLYPMDTDCLEDLQTGKHWKINWLHPFRAPKYVSGDRTCGSHVGAECEEQK